MTVYYNLEEATAKLRLKKLTTLQQAARKKQIEHAKVGRDLVFAEEALDAYYREHVVGVEATQWGLTDAAANAIRDARPARARKAG